MFAIRTTRLSRAFGPLRALESLTLDVPSGAVFGLLGPNGAGKTTTIRLLLGLVAPTEGTAEVLGYDVRTHADAVRGRCGALLEHTGLYDRLTARENLEYHARIWRLSSADRRARIDELLRRFDLAGRERELVGTWSRGMRQKLAIARAMLHRPTLLFLDEPAAGLDPAAAAGLREDLARLAAGEGVTIFLTTHQLIDVERLCAQAAILRAGHLVAAGSPDALRARVAPPVVEIDGRGFGDDVVARLAARPEVAHCARAGEHLTVTMHEGASVAPLVRLLVASGAEVESVVRPAATLEAAYLALIREGT